MTRPLSISKVFGRTKPKNSRLASRSQSRCIGEQALSFELLLDYRKAVRRAKPINLNTELHK